METKKIEQILTKYKELFDALENYDRTREIPTQRRRIDITLSVKTINKLRLFKEKTKRSISAIIEEGVEKFIGV